ncbi:hypothetical protein NKDENANG_03268 [Candidatus Entotheonellaceae bacterium PAL068K]
MRWTEEIVTCGLHTTSQHRLLADLADGRIFRHGCKQCWTGMRRCATRSYTLAIETDQNANLAVLRLSDEHGTRLAANQVRLSDHSLLL